MNRIPRRVLDFVLANIENVTALEILCVMHADTQKEWAAAELATALRSSSQSVGEKIRYLEKRGILAVGNKVDHYRINPDRKELETLLGEVCQSFRTYQSRIIELIYSDRKDRNIRSFAEAFVINPRSDDPGEEL